MSKQTRTRYRAEFKARAVAMVKEATPHRGSVTAAMDDVAAKLGISSRET